MALNPTQKKTLVRGLGKVLSALVKGAAAKRTPKSNNLGAPATPQKSGCGPCGPRRK